MPKKKKKSIILKLRNYFVTGVIVLIPIGFTLYLSKFLINFAESLVPSGLNPNTYLPYVIPGIEIISGSLGHGLPIAAGMALADKFDNKNDRKTFVVLGDGECYEGSVWEAANFAAHHKLNNLYAIIDRNTLITHGSTEDINALEPLKDKFSSFGWYVHEIDGHNFNDLLNFFKSMPQNKITKPIALIANTVKGKGVSFMENNAAWHHGGIDEEKFFIAEKELKQSNK